VFGDDEVGLGEEESTGVGVAAGDPVGGQLGVIGGGRVRGLRDGCSSMVEYAKVVWGIMLGKRVSQYHITRHLRRLVGP